MSDQTKLKLTQPLDRPLVAASILASDFARVAEDCRDVLSRGADLLHIDVMDGHFVSNLTIGADMIRALRRHFPDTCLDVHLMVERPGDFVAAFADAGADVFSFHAEVSQPMWPGGEDAGALIERIRSHGMAPGMVINPSTAAESLEPWLDGLDLVLVMSVVPGWGGQAFMPEVLPKTRWLRNRLRPTQRLEMDGGLAAQTAPQAREAGVDVLVAGSALFGASDRAAAIRQIRGA